MHNIYLKDLLKIYQGNLIQGNLDTLLESFSKDTRTIKKGDVYLGFKGENINGNDLYYDALTKGSIGCILSKDTQIDKDILAKYPDTFIYLVDDVIECLQSLAKYKRSLYDILVVAITGSVGKTSTKDIVASVLSQKYKVLKTEGNYNNNIGLPLTILSLKDENCLVLEMGMNGLGQIDLLSKIAKPTISIITNIGTSHIGILKSRENILKAKLEILNGMDNKVLIINNDNDLLNEYYLNNQDKIKFITYGIENHSMYQAINIQSDELASNYDIDLNNKIYNIKLNVPGNHFILNSLVGVAIGCYLDIPIAKIKKGILNFNLTKKRMEIIKVNNITLINDAYNASLDSMASALNYLGSLKNTRKIAVLGDMFELGDYSEKLHREVGKILYQNKIDILLTVGDKSQYICKEAIKLGFNKNNCYKYKSNEELLKNIFDIIKGNDTILIKASNGMHFSEIYNNILNKLKSSH